MTCLSAFCHAHRIALEDFTIYGFVCAVALAWVWKLINWGLA